jgi:hypothetical protein
MNHFVRIAGVSHPENCIFRASNPLPMGAFRFDRDVVS